MILLQRRAIRFLSTGLAIALSACGGEDLTLPADARPSHIDVITGDHQAGIAGTDLSLPLVVKITDDLDRRSPASPCSSRCNRDKAT